MTTDTHTVTAGVTADFRNLVTALRRAGWRHSLERTYEHDIHRWRRDGQAITAWMDSCGLDGHLLFEADETADWGNVVVTRDWIDRFGLAALRKLAQGNALLVPAGAQ